MLYLIANGPMPTTAGQAKVTTGTSVKTMLQVKGITPFKIVEWGFSFDGTSAATPGICELIETGTVFGTVTASVANDCVQYDAEAIALGDPTSLYLSVGTSATGYTCTSEGSITATRQLDPQLIAPTNQYVKQFPLGREPFVLHAKSCRIRCTFGSAINAFAYMVLSF